MLGCFIKVWFAPQPEGNLLQNRNTWNMNAVELKQRNQPKNKQQIQNIDPALNTQHNINVLNPVHESAVVAFKHKNAI